MQRAVFWGVIVVSITIVVLATRAQNAVVEKTRWETDQVLADFPWARDTLSLNGREITLKGEIEPGRNTGALVSALDALPSVRTVSSEIEIVPTPTASFSLAKTAEKISLSGTLNGDDLDRIVKSVQRAFPLSALRDRIRVDDRVGSPFWMGTTQSVLETLQPLDSFDFYGWRDTILINGIAATDRQRSLVQHSLAAKAGNNIAINYRVSVAPAPESARLSLVAGWNGAALSGRIPDQKTGRLLISGLVDLANVADDSVSSNLEFDTSLSSPRQIRKAAALLPRLHKVHDLRIETSGTRLALWGRVDDGLQLGSVLKAVSETGLDEMVENNIYIDSASRAPELSLFRDSSRAIVSGRMPGLKTRSLMLDSLENTLGIDDLESFISVEPDVTFSPWLEQWPTVARVIPTSAFGLTIADNAVIVSGDAGNKGTHRAIIHTLEGIFAGMRIIDWMTISDE